jgi:hypothetical protein
MNNAELKIALVIVYFFIFWYWWQRYEEREFLIVYMVVSFIFSFACVVSVMGNIQNQEVWYQEMFPHMLFGTIAGISIIPGISAMILDFFAGFRFWEMLITFISVSGSSICFSCILFFPKFGRELIESIVSYQFY